MPNVYSQVIKPQMILYQPSENDATIRRFTISPYLERAIISVNKKYFTVLDAILKIGSFIGFIKIFSSLMGVVNHRIFLRKL